VPSVDRILPADDLDRGLDRLEGLGRAVRDVRRVRILTHNVPDPDALAAAAGLRLLLRERWGVRAGIFYRGRVSREENRMFMRLCGIRAQCLDEGRLPRSRGGDMWAVVDAQPGRGNVWTPPGVAPGIVLDHHPAFYGGRYLREAAFVDLRPAIGATTTMVGTYLVAAGIPAPARLATAMCYAIQSETQDLGREAAEADRRIYLWAHPQASLKLLARIRNAPKSRRYFAAVARAVAAARTYRHVVWADLEALPAVELIPEMADFLLQAERITWALCLGRSGDRLVLALRSARTDAHCARLIRRIAGRNASVGGHGQMAGGYVDIAGRSEAEVVGLRDDIIGRYLRILTRTSGDRPVAGAPLVGDQTESHVAKGNVQK